MQQTHNQYFKLQLFNTASCIEHKVRAGEIVTAEQLKLYTILLGAEVQVGCRNLPSHHGEGPRSVISNLAATTRLEGVCYLGRMELVAILMTLSTSYITARKLAIRVKAVQSSMNTLMYVDLLRTVTAVFKVKT